MHGLHASCHPPVKPGGSSHSQSGHGSSASPPKGAKKKKMVFSLRFFRPNGDTTGKAVLEVHRRNSKDVKQSVPLQPDGLASDEVDRSEVNALWMGIRVSVSGISISNTEEAVLRSQYSSRLFY